MTAFTLVATLGFLSTDAEAQKDKKLKPIVISKSPQREWDSARMTVAFFRHTDGSYVTEEISKPLNPLTKLPIASLAKSMAAVIIFEAIEKGDLDPNQMIKIYPESKNLKDSYFSVVGLHKEWKEIPVHSAITQLLQLSSNTMAMNLAIAVAGSPEKFVMMMNAKAKEWGMSDTHFVTEHGLPIGDRKLEFTTAKDLTILAGGMLRHLKAFKSYTNASLTYWNPPPTTPKFKNPDVDKLALIEEGAVIKTGTINGCQSLLSILPTEGAVIADIQLCAPKYSRFKNALATLRDTFGKVLGVAIPNATAATQDLPQDRPSPQ